MRANTERSGFSIEIHQGRINKNLYNNVRAVVLRASEPMHIEII